jgi:hypothetical protein
MRSMFFGLLTATAVSLLLASACSSSTTACPKGEVCTAAGSGSATSGTSASSGGIFHRFDDGGTEGSTVSLVNDGTTGLPCTKDTDCVGDGGPGVNKCSSNYQLTVAGVGVQLWASPVCLIPIVSTGNCDPGTDPNQIQFCDGDDPNDPASPGVCMPINPSQPVTGQGICFPKCTFAPDGSAATGCVGHDACGLVTYLLDATADGGAGNSLSDVVGIGVCQSACQVTADCAALGATYDCEPDIGDCTMAKVARTSPIGATCTTDDQTAGKCFCATGSGSSGFCTSTCIVGAAVNSCPSGWVCDTGEPTTLDFGAGTPTFPALTTQTKGMLGVCTPACSGDAGTAAPASDAAAAADGAATPEASAPLACPGTSTCFSGTIAGPDCEP